MNNKNAPEKIRGIFIAYYKGLHYYMQPLGLAEGIVKGYLSSFSNLFFNFK